MGLKANEIDAHVGRRMRQRRETLGLSQGGARAAPRPDVQPGAEGREGDEPHRCRPALPSRPVSRRVPLEHFYEGPRRRRGGSQNRRSAADERELEAIQTAYLSISDPETRSSVLALLCSLAPGDPRARKAGGSCAGARDRDIPTRLTAALTARSRPPAAGHRAPPAIGRCSASPGGAGCPGNAGPRGTGRRKDRSAGRRGRRSRSSSRRR